MALNVWAIKHKCRRRGLRRCKALWLWCWKRNNAGLGSREYGE